MFLSTEMIHSVLDLSTSDIESVFQGPASSILLCGPIPGEFFVGNKLKEFLQDFHRAGEFYIPDDAQVLQVDDTHYGSIYERFRGMEEAGMFKSLSSIVTRGF